MVRLVFDQIAGHHNLAKMTQKLTVTITFKGYIWTVHK